MGTPEMGSGLLRTPSPHPRNTPSSIRGHGGIRRGGIGSTRRPGPWIMGAIRVAVTKVLVVESDGESARVLRTGLGDLGFSVRVVEDPDHGLDVSRYDRPDLILV